MHDFRVISNTRFRIASYEAFNSSNYKVKINNWMNSNYNKKAFFCLLLKGGILCVESFREVRSKGGRAYEYTP